MWRLEFSAAAEQDFERIFDHLCTAYTDLGDDPSTAISRAGARIMGLREDMELLRKTPHIGTLRPDIRPGLRFLRKDKAVIWFLPEEDAETILIVAVFFGGQDHIRHMLTRALADQTPGSL